MEIRTIGPFLDYRSSRRPPELLPGYDSALAPGKNDVIAFMDRLDGESVAIFKTLTDEDLQKKCVTPAGVSITIWKWLRAMVEHEAHHRGQIFMMLSMLGVKSLPLYGLTEEEVRSRSVSR